MLPEFFWKLVDKSGIEGTGFWGLGFQRLGFMGFGVANVRCRSCRSGAQGLQP